MLRKRSHLVVTLALASAVVASVVWAWLVAPSRFIVGVAAAGPDEAIFLTRRNDDDATDWWVELVALDGEHLWSTKVSPLETSEHVGFTGAVMVGDRVVVIGQERGTASGAVLALSRQSGEQLWQTALPSGPNGAGRIGPMLLPDGGRIYIVHEIDDGEGVHERVDALALEDGARLWQSEPLESNAEVHLLAPGRLLVGDSVHGRAVVLDGATGKVVAELPTLGIRCSTPEGVIGTQQGRPMLIGASGTTWEGELEADWRLAWEGPCGVRGDFVIVGARHTSSNETAVFALDRATGQKRWHARLKLQNFDEVQSIDGRLPRFLPIAMFGSETAEGPLVRELVVVDLDASGRVQQLPLEENAIPIVTADRAFVWLMFADVLIELDPQQGVFTSATHFSELDHSDMRVDDFRFGTLWLQGEKWARPSTALWPSAGLPFATVDMNGNTPVRLHGGITARDVTAQWRAKLGS